MKTEALSFALALLCLSTAAWADPGEPSRAAPLLAERARLDAAEKQLVAALAVAAKAEAAACRELPRGGAVRGQISVTTSRGETDNVSDIAVDLYPEKIIRQWLGGVNALAPAEIKNLTALSTGTSSTRFEMNLAAWNSISKYEKFAPLPVRAAETDAEGKFSIDVPRGDGPFYLVAQATNETEDRLELYLWIIKAAPGQTLWLNNSNMASDSIDLSNT
jgi:hypothetical protein